jgi:hypothetical protein
MIWQLVIRRQISKHKMKYTNKHEQLSTARDYYSHLIMPGQANNALASALGIHVFVYIL